MNAKLILPLIALAGCTTPSFQGVFGPTPVPTETVVDEPTPTLDETPAPPPPANATTVAEFDTTTVEEREAAVTQVAAVETRLGVTIASLGSPADPGIWLKTPLVTELSPGRVVYNGKSVNVELRPSGGVAGSGSQISLAAMRLIEAPLTSLPELEVFKQ
ncbi:D-galactarate dehydratase [Yoonia maritima]|uniref:D-galactarate dehydratase n=1 Tax=Yoonia maritima TaxID=1435347 RepID=UPI00373501E9